MLKKNNYNSSALIAILQDTQKAVGFLPKEVMMELAEQLSIPISQVYSVATFYSAFKMTPCGKHIIKVCLGTACHIKGGQLLMDKLETELKVAPDEPTEDGLFSYEAVRCVGCCGLAPVVMVDETFFGKVKPGDIPGIIDKYRKQYQ